MKMLTGQEVIAKLAEGSLKIVYAREEGDGTVYCTATAAKPEPFLPAEPEPRTIFTECDPECIPGN